MPDDLASNYDAGVFHHSPALALGGKLLFFNGLQTNVRWSFGVSGEELLQLSFVQVSGMPFEPHDALRVNDRASPMPKKQLAPQPERVRLLGPVRRVA